MMLFIAPQAEGLAGALPLQHPEFGRNFSEVTSYFREAKKGPDGAFFIYLHL